MILVKAEDSFLYQTKFVNTGNKVYVEITDIPKLVNAGKISPSYMEYVEGKTPQPEMKGTKLDVIIQDEYESPDKFLKQARKSKNKKNK